MRTLLLFSFIVLMACEKEETNQKEYFSTTSYFKTLDWKTVSQPLSTIKYETFSVILPENQTRIFENDVKHEYQLKPSFLSNNIVIYYKYILKENKYDNWVPDYVQFNFGTIGDKAYEDVKVKLHEYYTTDSLKFYRHGVWITLKKEENKAMFKLFFCKDSRDFAL